MSNTPNRRLLDRVIGSASPTLIGQGSAFTGSFDCAGDLVVSGSVNGNGKVVSSVTISDTGKWVGDIDTALAIVAGELVGNIVVADKLEIRRTGRIRGNVRAKSIAIATGAVIDGDMAIIGNTPVVHFDERRETKSK
jgi:cytoskeletal protein CcmA (bactofilin family)